MARKQLPPCSGIYLLVISLIKRIEKVIGALGEQTFAKGTYTYVGSARGPGGLQARISRHLHSEKTLHWHIDYLLSNPNLKISKIMYYLTERDLECTLTKKLVKRGAKPIIEGFGSSDCCCTSHLFKIDEGFVKDITIQGRSLTALSPPPSEKP